MWSAFLTELGGHEKNRQRPIKLRAIGIPAVCIHGLLLSLGGAPQLQTTPDQAAQLRASLQTNPEDLSAREPGENSPSIE
jgi:hypothetical protein